MGAPLPQILVVDDDVAVGKVLVSLLTQAQLGAEHVPSAERALERLAQHPFDLVLSDLKMAGLDGMALLKKLSAEYPDVPVVMITAHGSVENAVEAVKLGAFDYLEKPFEQEQIRQVVAKAISTYALARRDGPRVLLGDLITAGHLKTRATISENTTTDERRELIERTLSGLRAL